LEKISQIVGINNPALQLYMFKLHKIVADQLVRKFLQYKVLGEW